MSDKTKTILIVISLIIMAVAIIILHNETTPATKNVLEIPIGMYGVPSPYKFYPRGPGYVLTSFLFDTLVWKDESKIIPWLAESWHKINSTTWIFHLRNNVYWSDGVELTAQDVAFTYNYMKEHGWQWTNINTSLIKKSIATDNHTVVITLEKPYPFFIEDYAATIFILPMHIWSKVDNPYTYNAQDIYVSSGPYRIKTIKQGEYILLVRNKDYFAGIPEYKEIKILVSTDIFNAKENLVLLENKEIKTAVFQGKTFCSTIRDEIEEDKKLKIESHPMYWGVILGFNLQKTPGNQTFFRKAISLAIDYHSLLEAIGGDCVGEIGRTGYIPSYSWFFNDKIQTNRYDPNQAKNLLLNKGFKMVNNTLYYPDGQKVVLHMITLKRFLQEAGIIKTNLAKIGITVEIKSFPSLGQLDAESEKGDFDLILTGHGSLGNTLSSFQWFFNGRFGIKWNDADYWSIVGKMLSTDNQTLAIEYSYMAQELISEETPAIVLYYPYIYMAYDSTLPIKPFFTYNGLDTGVPLPYNKLFLISSEQKIGGEREQ